MTTRETQTENQESIKEKQTRQKQSEAPIHTGKPFSILEGEVVPRLARRDSVHSEKSGVSVKSSIASTQSNETEKASEKSNKKSVEKKKKKKKTAAATAQLMQSFTETMKMLIEQIKDSSNDEENASDE